MYVPVVSTWTTPDEALMTVGLLLSVTVPEDNERIRKPDEAVSTSGAEESVIVPLETDIVPVTRYVPVVRT
jgi:hypothetical protein